MSERKEKPEVDMQRVAAIISSYKGKKWGLIPLLQNIQKEVGYIPPEAVEQIAQAAGVFPTQVQGVLTFYAGLHTKPHGKKVVRVCRGTACHVRGGKTILKLVKKQLGIEEGETTPDYEYTLETVACIGGCALAPNMVVGSTTHGHMNPKKVTQLLSRKNEDEHGR